MSLSDILLALSVAILWGVNFVAIKVGLLYVSPLLLMAVRFGLAALLLAPWLLQVPREQWRPFVGIALTMVIGYFCILFIGMRAMPAGESTIIIQVQVPFAALMAFWFFLERFSWQVVVGTVVAMLSVVVTVGVPQSVSGLVPVLMILLAATFWAVSANQIRALGRVKPLALNAVYTVIAFPVISMLAYWFEWPQQQAHAVQHVAAAFMHWPAIATACGLSC